MRMGISLGINRGGAVPFDPLNLTPTYWIDATNGSDSNDGLTLVGAWKSLNKITGIALPAGANIVVRVVSDTYDTADDWIERSDSSGGGTIGAGARLTIVFEPGCVMDGTAANALAAQNGFEISGSNVWTTYVYGHDLALNNYSEGTASSPNGVGNRGNNILYVYDVHATNCDDGFSAHATAKMYLYRCSASGCEKSPFLHVDTAYVEAYQCSFTGGTSTTVIGIGAGTPTVHLYDTICAPGTTTTSVNVTTALRCHLGTTAARLAIVGGTATDCFVNVYNDGNQAINLQRCYGKVSLRIRGSATQVVNGCVISGPATGQTSVIFSNFNFGTAQALTFTNNIVETATAGAFMSVDAANAGYMVAKPQLFSNNVLSGSAAFDADLIAADTGGTVIVSNTTGDALIGAANTTNPSDYGYASGSPAIGAGIGGINCGLSVSDAASIALRPAA